MYDTMCKHEINGNYFIIEAPKELIKYQIKMIQSNEMSKLLNMTIKYNKNSNNIQYTIDSKISLDEYIKRNKIESQLVNTLIEDIKEINMMCREYLLVESSFLFSPEAIYIDCDSNRLFYTYIPCELDDNALFKQIDDLVGFLMHHINTNDKAVIQSLHQLIILIKENNFSAKSLIKLQEGTLEQDQEITTNHGIISKSLKDENHKKIELNIKGISHRKEQIKALSKEAKVTFMILELMTLMIVILVMSKVMFTSENTLIILFKVIFFLGLLFMSQYLIIKKVIIEDGKDLDEKSVIEAQPTSKEKAINSVKITKDKGSKKPYLINENNEKIEINKLPFIIGSIQSEVDLLISNRTVSKRHARIISEEDNYYIEDLNSKNGTYMNNQKVDEATLLITNSKVTFSNESYVFRMI